MDPVPRRSGPGPVAGAARRAASGALRGPGPRAGIRSRSPARARKSTGRGSDPAHLAHAASVGSLGDRHRDTLGRPVRGAGRELPARRGRRAVARVGPGSHRPELRAAGHRQRAPRARRRAVGRDPGRPARVRPAAQLRAGVDLRRAIGRRGPVANRRRPARRCPGDVGAFALGVPVRHRPGGRGPAQYRSVGRPRAQALERGRSGPRTGGVLRARRHVRGSPRPGGRDRPRLRRGCGPRQRRHRARRGADGRREPGHGANAESMLENR